MIKLLLHRKTQDSFEEITRNWNGHDILVVTPNPATADLVRLNFEKLGHSISSITISKFMKDELSELVDSDILENYKGKSEILFLLGAIWKNLQEQDDYIAFKRAFNILTEFRSYSTEESVLETVLENYDEDLAHGVLWLNRFMDSLGIVDEHKSYFLLAEILRAGDLPPSYKAEKTIVFYGFDFLTASQIDLVKALSLRGTVLIPFFKDVYEKSVSVDWINWFDEHRLEVIDLVKDIKLEKELDLYEFPKNYLGKELDSIAKDKEFDTVLIGNKGLTREIVQEVPFHDFQFKVPIDLFNEKFQEVSKQVYEYLGRKDILLSDFLEEVNTYLNEKIKHSDFRGIKVYLLLITKVKEWENLSDKHTSISEYDLNIILESLELDLPRTNLTTLISRSKNKILSLSEMDIVKQKKVIWSLSSAHSGFMGIGGNFSDSVEKYLGSIGPIRRSDLDLLILKNRFEEFIEDNEVTFLIEEGLLQEKAQLSKVFNDVLLKKKVKPLDFQKTTIKVEREFIQPTHKSLSASRLQKYKDCPQKYYNSYISKIDPQVKLPSQVDVLLLGSLEHKIIEEYFKFREVWDEDFYKKLVLDIFNKNIMNSDVQMPDKVLVELYAYTSQTIQKLVELKELLSLEFKFEFPFQTNNYDLKLGGSIDLFGSNQEMTLIIDFKRSDRLFSSYTKMEEMEQVQLWFYLMRLSELERVNFSQNIVLGYVNLSDFSTSRLITNNKDLEKSLKKELGISYVKEISNFEEAIERYQEMEKELVLNLKQDDNFNPNPSNKNVCDFCSIKNICERN